MVLRTRMLSLMVIVLAGCAAAIRAEQAVQPVAAQPANAVTCPECAQCLGMLQAQKVKGQKAKKRVESQWGCVDYCKKRFNKRWGYRKTDEKTGEVTCVCVGL
jgi:hypothetical protein